MIVNFLKYNIKSKQVNNKSFIWDIIRKKWIVFTDEESVRQIWLNFLVYDCNIPINRISVERQMIINNIKKRFDICIYSQKMTPDIIFEIKSPKVSINLSTIEQLSTYNIYLNANKFIISNGLLHFGLKLENKNFSEILNFKDIL